jgi:4-hydroxy-tetrahydrodipicolinate reductase
MGSSEKIRIMQYGLGPVGLMVIRQILARRDLELVGAIDIDPKKHQRDVADLSGLKRPSGIRVSNRPQEILGVNRPHIVLHTTGSSLKEVFPQLSQCLDHSARIISTCEELLLPSVQQPLLARELDRMAKAKETVLVGTGVNPGFVMDTMAVAATAPCLDVRSIRVARIVDASTRREPLQRKVGAGLTTTEFKRGLRRGELGHKGLKESLHLIARGLGWRLDNVTEKVQPVLATRSVKTDYLKVKKGDVAGIHHVCRGFRNRKEILNLDLQMFVGAKKPTDRIAITGTPEVNLEFEGGIAGDEASVAMLLNMIPPVLDATPGLKTMVDLPVPRFSAIDE